MARINYGEGRRPIPMFATITIIILAAVSTIFVLLITLKQPGSFGETRYNDVKQVTEGIVPGKDVILTNNITSVYIPNGATSLNGNLTIIPLEQNLFPAAGEPGWTRPIAVKIEFQDSEGSIAPVVTFSRPVLLCFKLNEAQWQDYTSRVSSYQVEYYAEALSLPRWEQLPIYAYPDRFQICGATNHLSVFALAINPAEGTTVSEIPNTGSQPNLLTSLLTTFDFYGKHDRDYFLAVGPTGVLVVTTQTAPPPTSVPPTSEPPTSEPPTPVVTDPPTAVVTDPPTAVVTDPPTAVVTDPPTAVVTDPPATDPPATDPPATDPPATDPPATDPPATDPPATDPPATDPPAGWTPGMMFVFGNVIA